LIATGGNAGAQSATLIIRAIATGDLRADQWLWAVGKELLVGLGLGVTLGLATWFLGFYRGGFDMAIIILLTMTAIVLVSNLIGVGLPFLLNKLKLDPAVASSPLITTVVDFVGLTIYFSIAVQIL
jgi:magnesium transporter